MKQIMTLLVASGLFISSCSKKETTTPPGQTPTVNKTPSELLVGTWWLVSGIYTRPGIADSNILTNCMMDDTLIFNADGIFFHYDGPLKCDPNEPARRKGVWQIDSHPYLITKDSSNFTAYSDTTEVLQLDETNLKYSSEYDNDGNKMTITWKRK